MLSMHGLSHGVVRVDTEEKLSVLTVQDVGQVMPGGKASQRLPAAANTGCLWSALEACPPEQRLKTIFHSHSALRHLSLPLC